MQKVQQGSQSQSGMQKVHNHSKTQSTRPHQQLYQDELARKPIDSIIFSHSCTYIPCIPQPNKSADRSLLTREHTSISWNTVTSIWQSTCKCITRKHFKKMKCFAEDKKCMYVLRLFPWHFESKMFIYDTDDSLWIILEEQQQMN